MQTRHKLSPKRPFQAILSLGLALSLMIPVQASPLSDEIDSLISADLFAHQSDIQTKAAGLASSERAQLFQRHHKNALTGSLLNLLPIFGYGSYQQGDLIGGISLSVLDGLSYGFLAATWISGSSNSSNTLPYAYVGLMSFMLGRIVGIASPQVHGALYNITLQQSLSSGSAPLTSSAASNLNSWPLLAFEHQF